jgi:hypothetical protein
MKPEKKAKNLKEKSKKVPKKKGNSTLIIGVVAVILLAGIAYAVLSGGSTSQKTTESNIKLPSYAYTNPLTLKAYRYATEHPEILEQIPCYCGCGGHSGHRFLRDCFIHDDRTYDDHASFCDVCIGEAIKVQDYLAQGKTLKEARALIDEEYSKKGGDRTDTPPVSDYYMPILSPIAAGTPTSAPPKRVDLSAYNLPDNFKNLADGLKLTPAGVNRAYFINTKMVVGTEMEPQYVEGSVEPDAFYGKKLIGMYSADFSPTSWIELHDLGYDSTKDTALVVRLEQGMKNIVYTRPLIYGHSQNVDNVLKLMKDPTSMSTSYSTYKPLLDAVDYQNAAYAQVIMQPGKFSDMSYLSLTPVNGKTEMVRAFNITDNKSIPAAFNKYAPQTKDNILIIKVTGALNTVHSEEDNIDAAART